MKFACCCGGADCVQLGSWLLVHLLVTKNDMPCNFIDYFWTTLADCVSPQGNGRQASSGLKARNNFLFNSAGTNGAQI